MNTELLLKVKNRVLAEPGRVDMRDWQQKITDPTDIMLMGQRISIARECGTVCCILGHAVEISGGAVPDDVGVRTIISIGSALLDLDYEEADSLFMFHNSRDDSDDPYFDLALRLLIFEPGSKEYAAIVAEAIDRCIARNGSTVETQPEADTEDVCAALERSCRLGLRVLRRRRWGVIGLC